MAVVYEVKITAQAESQMAEIVDYITNELFVPDAAENLLTKLERSILGLSRFPEKHQLIEEELWRSEGVRKIVVNNFLVYFWIDKNQKKVQVFAVIYEKRDQIEQLRHLSL